MKNVVVRKMPCGHWVAITVLTSPLSEAIFMITGEYHFDAFDEFLMVLNGEAVING
jgi:hypothetical protein